MWFPVNYLVASGTEYHIIVLSPNLRQVLLILPCNHRCDIFPPCLAEYDEDTGYPHYYRCYIGGYSSLFSINGKSILITPLLYRFSHVDQVRDSLALPLLPHLPHLRWRYSIDHLPCWSHGPDHPTDAVLGCQQSGVIFSEPPSEFSCIPRHSPFKSSKSQNFERPSQLLQFLH